MSVSVLLEDVVAIIAAGRRSQVQAVDRLFRAFSSGQQSPGWPWWTWPTQPEFDEGFRNWAWNFQPWQAIQDGSLTETILAIVAQVETAFQGRMDLLMPDGEPSRPSEC